MKRILALLLAMAMVFSLCACGGNQKDKDNLIGTWEREKTYLEAYGCEAIMRISFNEDGSYFEVLKSVIDDEVLMSEKGYWELDGDEIRTQKEEHVQWGDGNTPIISYSGGSVCIYEYKSVNTIVNGENEYTKIS